MKFKKLTWLGLFLITALVLAVGSTPSATEAQDCEACQAALLRSDGCTVIMVGKAASADGSVITTHTCDCGSCDWTFRRVPAADWPAGAMRQIYHVDQFGNWPPENGLKWEVVKNNLAGLEIPQPAHTFGYIHGDFGYLNDNQVAIGESTIGTQRKLENQTPVAKFDITMLTLLAMERGKTARDAIKIMGGLAEKYGYGFSDTGEMLAVADPNEVWVFEIMPVGPLWTPQSGKPGAVWCAQRVPDDEVSVCPNESRIGEIDQKNPDYFMFSPNVVSFAVDQKLYDPKSGKPFNWKRAYSPNEVSAVSSNGSRVRLWRYLDLVAPSKKFSPETPNMDFPFSVKPDKKLSVYDVMQLTRDKCEGTPFDPSRGLQGGPFGNPNNLPYGFELEGKRYSTSRIIGVNRAEYVTITQSRGWLPNPVGGLVWLCWGSQDTSCYMPLYNGMTEIPRSFEVGDHWHFSRDSARWAFDYTDYHAQLFYNLAIQDVRAAQLKYEKAAVDRTANIDQWAADLHKKDPAEAARFLTDYCLGNANNVVTAWWTLGDQLLVKYNHQWIYDVKARKRLPVKYPDWYLKLLVEHNQIPEAPAGERH